MSRIQDYQQMRVMLATAEAENMNGNDLVEILYSGYDGYKYDSDEDILYMFLSVFGKHKVPKMPLTTEEMNKEALRQEDIRTERGDER